MRQASETVAGYEDSLIVFLIRLGQLQRKAAPAHAATMAAPGGPVNPWNVAAGDSDAFVAYLAVARQFWVKNEPTSYRRVARALLSAAIRLRDRDLQRRVRLLGRDFRKQAKATVTLAHGAASMRVPVETLAELWFNQLYFHTDLNSVNSVERVLADDALRTQARQEFVAYLDALVHYARQLGVEAVHVLEQGVLPKGRLHHLAEGAFARDLVAAL